MYTVRSLEITLGRVGKSVQGKTIIPETHHETLEEALSIFENRKQLLNGYFRIVMLEDNEIIKEYQNYD